MRHNVGRKLFLFYLLIPFLHIQFVSSAQTMYMKHYNVNNGLPSNNIFMHHQGLDGFMWMGAEGGLLRFDGKDFKRYDYTNGLIDDLVIALVNDKDNNIWAKPYLMSTSFSVVKNSSVTICADSGINILQNKGQKLLWALYAGKTGTAYMIGQEALMCIKDAKPLFKRTDLGIIVSFFETDDGTVLAGDGKNLYRIKDTTVSLFQSFGFGTPYTNACYYGGVMYLASGNTLKTYRYGSTGFLAVNSFRLRSKISKVHADKYGLWVNFFNEKELYLYRGNNLSAQPVKVMLPGLVNGIKTDREGGLWVSILDNGIVHVPNPAITVYSTGDGLPSESVFAVEPVGKNKMWLGYNSGEATLVNIDNNKIRIEKKVQATDEFAGYSNIVDIASDKKGKTFILSRSKLLCVTGGSVKDIPVDGSAYKSLAIINDSLLSIGSVAVKIFNTKTLSEHAFKTGRIYGQVMDAQNNLWLGGLKGLYRYQIGVDSIPFKVLLNDSIKITSIARHEPYTWLGTIFSGLYLLRNDSVIKHFDDHNLSIPSPCVRTLVAKDDDIWFGTHKGIFHGKFDYNTLAFSNCIQINHNDGLVSREARMIKLYDDRVFIATQSGGLAVLDNYVQDTINYTVSDVSFKNLANNDLITGDSIEVMYSTKGLEVEFHVAALKYNDEISYRYKLEPFHDEWRSTTNNIVQYTNIPPGNYNFLIDVQDNRANTTTTLHSTFIRVAPLYWQTTWFRALVLSLILIVIALAFYLYYRYNRQQTAKQLEQSRLMAQTRLQTLKAQIKPHFIFNSLNSLNDYIYTNNSDDVAKLLQSFSCLIRKGLHLADNDFYTIEREVIFLKQYLELEKVKCEHCFDYTIELNDDIHHHIIPCLFTQPFVENAVIHGMHSVKNTRAKLSISYSVNNDDIICRIEDNGIGINRSLQQKKEHISKGSDIAMERIAYYKTGLNCEIELDIVDKSDKDNSQTGTIITITFKNTGKFNAYENTDN